MSRWLCRFFNYLDRYYIARHTLHPLPDVALLRFRDEVFEKVKAPARDAVLDDDASDEPLLTTRPRTLPHLGRAGAGREAGGEHPAQLSASAGAELWRG